MSLKVELGMSLSTWKGCKESLLIGELTGDVYVETIWALDYPPSNQCYTSWHIPDEFATWWLDELSLYWVGTFWMKIGNNGRNSPVPGECFNNNISPVNNYFMIKLCLFPHFCDAGCPGNSIFQFLFLIWLLALVIYLSRSCIILIIE